MTLGLLVAAKFFVAWAIGYTAGAVQTTFKRIGEQI